MPLRYQPKVHTLVLPRMNLGRELVQSSVERFSGLGPIVLVFSELGPAARNAERYAIEEV